MKSIESTIANIENSLPLYAPDRIVLPQTTDRHSLVDRMAAYKVPGASVAVIEADGIAWEKGYGVLKNGAAQAVTPSSLFQACSASKMVAAAIVLHLVERGVFDLDEDVNRYLRSWKIPAGEFSASNPVTLRLLMSHQSGINRPDGGFEWQDGSTPSLVQILRGETPAIVQAAKVEFTPGSHWQYANFGYVVIQMILEDVLGKPFTEIAEELLLTPLAMADSTFRYPLGAGWAEREATLHDREANPTYPGLIPSAIAHGGLLTTPSDMARFGIELMQAYRGESDLLLSQDVVRRMFRQEVWVDDLEVFGFPFGQGLGVFLVRDAGYEIVFHPGGNDPGASCLLCILPDSGQGAAVMTNGLRGLRLTVELVSAIAHEYAWGGTRAG